MGHLLESPHCSRDTESVPGSNNLSFGWKPVDDALRLLVARKAIDETGPEMSIVYTKITYYSLPRANVASVSSSISSSESILVRFDPYQRIQERLDCVDSGSQKHL